MNKDRQTTHFGFKEIPTQEKASRVAEVFHSVANKYDLMNDVMSLGMHRLWKAFTLTEANARAGQIILDLAGGTGDLAKELAKQVGKDGLVILSDINDAMLQRGRERMVDEGLVNNITYVQADAEKLPFPDNFFNCITIAFGLRNVTNKLEALKSMHRVLKPGGKSLVLEFSKPTVPLFEKIYDQYSFKLIPKLGEWICNDRESYQYLVESIRVHPDQETLKKIMEEAGFEDVQYHNLSCGMVALHKGYKY